MTDVTITFGSAVHTTSYITYYAVVPSINMLLVFQSAVSSTISISDSDAIDIEVGTGILVILRTTPRSYSYSRDLSVVAFINLSNVIAPVLSPNSRPAGSTLDNNQKLDIRNTETEERTLAVKKYLQVAGNVSSMTTSDRQIYSRNIIRDLNSVQSNRITIATLANNYNFRTKQAGKPTPVIFRKI